MKILLLLFVSLCITQMKADKAQTVIDFARSKVGCGYCWGTYGQRMSESLLAELIEKFGSAKVEPEVQRRKNMGKIVYDCAGLVAKAFNQIGIKPYTGATKTWKNLAFDKKGTISQLPKDKVAILYKGDGNEMSHTGIYIKNDRFVHAKGANHGVLEENMSACGWTHFGIPTGLYTPDETPKNYPFKGKVIASSGNTVNLRDKPTKSGSTVLKQVKLGEIVTVTGGENGWYNVIYGDLKGYMMMEFIQQI